MGIVKKRRRELPRGWYPDTAEDLKKTVEQWERSIRSEPELHGLAAIVPHAGWAFSGSLAYKTLRRLNRDVETVVLVGGHLPAGSGLVAAYEDLFETPMGDIPGDSELLQALSDQLALREDRRIDNTVEVQLPFIPVLFPRAKLLWLRVGASEEALELGRCLSGISEDLGRRINVVGSTDLTHYGPNYNFTPHGSGEQAREWAQNVNDAAIIRAMLEMDAQRVLELGNEKQAACSAGAAAAVIEYASVRFCREGVLVGYDSSYSLHRDSSFVGYAGVLYSSASS
ncbi:MAG TPA: AmmeMemoRadiSam system protein B [Sediminispirochaeta sp.]|nr:AmmeMemoRadiSam system protein B [Sediminispirochaeta sp.]